MDFDFFAFTTAIGKKLEAATSELNVQEDWSLNLEITDDINATDNGPKDAVKAIKRRLTSKDERVLMLTLTVRCPYGLLPVVPYADAPVPPSLNFRCWRHV